MAPVLDPTGPAQKLGQVTFRKRNDSEPPYLVSKRFRRYQNRDRQKFAGSVPTGPDYGRNGIRHIGGLILSEAAYGTWEPSVSMQTEKPQVV